MLAKRLSVKLRVLTGSMTMACCLTTACGSSAPSLPKSTANVAACKAFDQVVNGANMAQLTGLVLESDAPITHQLRQDLGNYIALATTGGTAAAEQAAAKAKQDCSSLS